MNPIKISTLALAALLMSFTPPRPVAAAMPNPAIHKSAAIEWKHTEVDLGEIPQNKPVTIEFEFKNTGELPVVISHVQASCGCTSTNYVKEPVQPGQTTKISAVYNAAAKGIFKKTISVTTTAKATAETLSFNGTVI